MGKMIKILILVNLSIVNCMVGTKERACKYYVERDYGSWCENLTISTALQTGEIRDSQRVAFNVALVGCLTYLSKIESCEKEENKYQPGLYGMFILEKDLEIKINPEKLNLVRRVES